MSEAKWAGKGRVFTIELTSGKDLKRVTIPNGSQHLLMEGTIGALKQVEFVEDAVLELVGTGGVIRVDLSRDDLPEPSRKPQGGEAE